MQDGSTFFGFSDPDGNTWAVQELKVREREAADSGGPHRSQRMGRSLILRRTPSFPSRREPGPTEPAPCNARVSNGVPARHRWLLRVAQQDSEVPSPIGDGPAADSSTLIVLAEAVAWASVTERVQVLRGGQARAYVIAEEHEDGSLLLAPEPVPSAQATAPAEDGRAAPVAVPEGRRDPPGARPDGRLRRRRRRSTRSASRSAGERSSVCSGRTERARRAR